MTAQVQLSDRAYRALKARKRPDESYSDVVLRLLASTKDPMAFVGRRASKLTLEERLRRAREAKGPEL